MGEWGRLKSMENPLAMARRVLAHPQDAFTIARTVVVAVTDIQRYKSGWELQKIKLTLEESIDEEPNSPGRDWKMVHRVHPDGNPT